MTITTISSGTIPVTPAATRAGDVLAVESGGTALSARIAGGNEQLSGTDLAATVTSGGFQYIVSGGRASGTLLVDGGVQSLTSGASASAVEIRSGGSQDIGGYNSRGSSRHEVGGAASGSIVGSGGYQAISAGGTAIDTTVSSGGTVLVGREIGSNGTASAVVSSLTIQSGGYVAVSAYGTIANGTIAAGGVLVAESGSTVSGLAIASGAYVIVEPGATVASGADVIDSGTVLIQPDGQVTRSVDGLTLSSGARVLVLNGGVESGATLLAGATDAIFSGGTAKGVTLDDGAETVSSGGVASGTIIKDSGVQYVFFGGDAVSTIVSNGFEIVTFGGTAAETTVGSGGTDIVSAGGLALSATIESGGFQTISAGGTASATTVTRGGFERVSASGTALATTVSAGGTALIIGKQVVESSGTYVFSAVASGLTVANGGRAEIGNALLSATTVESGGVLIAQSGSTLSGLSVESGGYAIIEPGASANVVSGTAISTGAVVIDADDSVRNLTDGENVLSGAQALVLTDGIVSGGTLLPGANEEIVSGGRTRSVTVDSSTQVINASAVASGSILENGGVQYVFSRGTAVSTTVSNGYSIVDAGGLARDTVIESGGVQAVDGIVSNTEVESGGALYVVDLGAAYSGSAIGAVVDAGGAAYVYGTMSGGRVSGFAILSSGTADGVTVAAGGEIIATNGTVSNLVVESGGVFVANGGAVIDPTIEVGGTFIELSRTILVTSTSGSIASGSLITGGHVVISGGTSASLYISSAGLTLQSGATGFVYGGGVESGTVIGLNAVDRVASGGVAYDDIIGAGGNLIISAGGAASGSVTFSGTGGTLALYDTLSAAVVNGFARGDTIDFETIQPKGAGALSASIDASGLLTVSSGGIGASVNLGSAYAGDAVSATASPAGGIAVTLVEPTSGTVTPTAQTPVDIPIYVLPFDGSYKLGIEVSLDGGQTYKMVELDTGASGFFAAYTPDWWSSYTPVGTAPDVMTYVSGNGYAAHVVNASVTLQTSSGSPLTVSNVNVGMITNAANNSTSGSGFSTQDWNTSLTSDPTTAPLEDYFYGDFGLGLNDNNGIEAVLGQLGNGLSNGFIINIGNYPDGAPGQIGALQVGLTEADIESYDTIIALNGQNLADTFANSGYATYGKAQATGTISIDGIPVPTNLIFDTGATHTTIFTGSTLTVDGSIESGKSLVDGSNVILSSPGVGSDSGWTLPVQSAGSTAGIDQIGVSPAAGPTNPGAVNTGIGAYYGESIMFDLADGIMGIKTIACFAEGTRIRTPEGERAVEMLSAGEFVTTIDGRAQSVRWIGHRAVDCRRHPDPASVWPVRVVAHAFGPNLPARDLLLSPDHALYLEGTLIPVRYLINGGSIAQLNRALVTYYHVELAVHDVIFAEGLPAETYLETGQRTAFANGGGIVQAHPCFTPAETDAQLLWATLGYAPLVISGPVVDRVRAGLADNRPSRHPPRIAAG